MYYLLLLIISLNAPYRVAFLDLSWQSTIDDWSLTLDGYFEVSLLDVDIELLGTCGRGNWNVQCDLLSILIPAVIGRLTSIRSIWRTGR